METSKWVFVHKTVLTVLARPMNLFHGANAAMSAATARPTMLNLLSPALPVYVAAGGAVELTATSETDTDGADKGVADKLP